MRLFKQVFFYSIIVFVTSSCITQKQYDAMNTKVGDLSKENDELKKNNNDLTGENMDLEREIKPCKNELIDFLQIP